MFTFAYLFLCIFSRILLYSSLILYFSTIFSPAKTLALQKGPLGLFLPPKFAAFTLSYGRMFPDELENPTDCQNLTIGNGRGIFNPGAWGAGVKQCIVSRIDSYMSAVADDVPRLYLVYGDAVAHAP